MATNIKSARTNLERHNIKSFRIRYLKLNRNSQTLDIEKNEIHNNKIFPNKLGPIIYKYNGQICEPNINRGVKINYNSITNKYTLLVPNYENPITENKEENMIILDPGLRTFMTGVSENSTIDICNDVNKTIKTKLEKNNILFEKAKQKINECESLQESEKQKLIDKKRNIKNKRNKRAYKKIHNMVDDLHWKTANYLAKNGCPVIYRSQVLHERAFYSLKQQLHEQLNLTHYTHATSPIRRYVDVLIQKLFKNIDDNLDNINIINDINTFEINLKRLYRMWDYTKASQTIKNGKHYIVSFVGIEKDRLEFYCQDLKIFISAKVPFTLFSSPDVEATAVAAANATVNIYGQEYTITNKYNLPLYLIEDTKNTMFHKILIEFEKN